MRDTLDEFVGRKVQSREEEQFSETRDENVEELVEKALECGEKNAYDGLRVL